MNLMISEPLKTKNYIYQKYQTKFIYLNPTIDNLIAAII